MIVTLLPNGVVTNLCPRYVSLTITLSSTHSPQYVFESWLQYCKSYNHICIDGTAQFERMWLQEEM